MKPPDSPQIVAVAQFCATNDVEANAAICIDLIAQAARSEAKMIFLPEGSDFISGSPEESIALTHSHSDKFLKSLQDASIEHGIWVSVGVHQKIPSTKSRIHNTHLIISPSPPSQATSSSPRLFIPAATYHKLHLFDVTIIDGPTLKESAVIAPGTEVIDPVETPIGKLGLAVCYDMRFPEISTELRKRGAEILAYPAAFAVITGRAHWEVLLRARAIETQSYVIASAQFGQHNETRASFGNAMIIDPWGIIVARCSESPISNIALAKIDLERLRQVRRDMPVFEHRRTDIFS
ncbi:hypothetical protein G9A89_016309 [Geosiphon pyriformis]|nr:hypothetical protein G9A89_016309 [Geosiphon pyriformis]